MIDIDLNDAAIQRQVQDLIKRFRELPTNIAKKRMRSAIRKAIKPFEPTLRANTPYRTGQLMRSIISKVKVYDKPTHGAIVSVIGYARGSLQKRRGQFVVSGSGHHALLVENGTKPRTRKNGGSCGTMPARHMARRTLDATRQPVLSALVSELASALEKATQEIGNGIP